jgi:7,8-dihydropterin-6-yl-methyl-4-(beta-D-ribofuranosyl)aminobenzene 5'-phosphate synthase
MPDSKHWRLSRREFLRSVWITASAAALGSCVPQTSTDTEVPPAETVGSATALVELTPEPVDEFQALTIRIVYNNVPHDGRMTTSWGFGALVEYGTENVLFDTGGDSPTLLGNMEILGIDPASIQKVLLSHIHDDHVGGLQGLLATGLCPVVYVPPSFPDSFKRQVGEITSLVEVEPGQAVAKGIFTTGEMPTPGHPDLLEQALVVESRGGWVIVTGCAHPGIVNIVERARELFDGPIFLAMGGFHLRDASEARVRGILADLRRLGVERVAPSHCTGERAIRMFVDEYGDKYVRSGAGSVIVIE